MQNIGINPQQVYTQAQFDKGNPGYELGEIGEDDIGNRYVFLQFNHDVGRYAYVRYYADYVGHSPDNSNRRSTQFAFVQADLGTVADDPVYAWAQVYGKGRGRFGITAAVGARLGHDVTDGLFTGIGGLEIDGIELLQASTTTNAARARFAFPVAI